MGSGKGKTIGGIGRAFKNMPEEGVDENIVPQTIKELYDFDEEMFVDPYAPPNYKGWIPVVKEVMEKFGINTEGMDASDYLKMATGMKSYVGLHYQNIIEELKDWKRNNVTSTESLMNYLWNEVKNERGNKQQAMKEKLDGAIQKIFYMEYYLTHMRDVRRATNTVWRGLMAKQGLLDAEGQPVKFKVGQEITLSDGFTSFATGQDATLQFAGDPFQVKKVNKDARGNFNYDDAILQADANKGSILVRIDNANNLAMKDVKFWGKGGEKEVLGMPDQKFRVVSYRPIIYRGKPADVQEVVLEALPSNQSKRNLTSIFGDGFEDIRRYFGITKDKKNRKLEWRNSSGTLFTFEGSD